MSFVNFRSTLRRGSLLLIAPPFFFQVPWVSNSYDSTSILILTRIFVLLELFRGWSKDPTSRLISRNHPTQNRWINLPRHGLYKKRIFLLYILTSLSFCCVSRVYERNLRSLFTLDPVNRPISHPLIRYFVLIGVARALTRWEIYEILESALGDSRSGKACLLRAICEASASPFDGVHGLASQLVHLLLTWVSDRSSERAMNPSNPCDRLLVSTLLSPIWLHYMENIKLSSDILDFVPAFRNVGILI